MKREITFGLAAITAAAVIASGCQPRSKHRTERNEPTVAEDVDRETDRAAERAEEMEREIREEVARAEEEAREAGGEIEEEVEETAETAESMTGKKVTAEVSRLDHENRTVVFQVRDSAEEIQLQAGREMEVDFTELEAITGLSEEDALDRLQEGEQFEVEVAGVGDAMKIIDIELEK